MQPYLPRRFPKKLKRFQSYSMTPLDSGISFNQPLSLASIPLSKFSLISFQKKDQTTDPNKFQNSLEFRLLQKQKSFTSDEFKLKSTHKVVLENENLSEDKLLKPPNLLDNKNQKKLVTSNIFLFSPSLDKNSSFGQKNSHFLLSKFKIDQKKILKNENIGKNQHKNENKNKEVRIPAFLLNKKKMTQSLEIQQYHLMTGQKILEVFSSFIPKTPIKDERGCNQKQTLLISNKSIQESQFCPPSNENLTFSKATASTVCTNLLREQSQRTIKDFEQLIPNKQLQNVVEQSQKQKALINNFKNLYKEEYQEKNLSESICNEIAELFSDEQYESEEFNQNLQHQLDQLF